MTTPTSTSVMLSAGSDAGLASAAAVVQNHRHCGAPVQKRRKTTGEETSESNNVNANTAGPTQPKGQFGFPVNGFHPQWSASSNILLAARSRDTTSGRSMSNTSITCAHRHDRQMLHSQNPTDEVGNKINELICRLRHDEEEKKKKRKRDLIVAAAEEQKKRASEKAAAAHSMAVEVSEDSSSSSMMTKKIKKRDFTSLYSDVFLKSNVAQIIVSPGGRILAWNETFVNTTDLTANQISDSLTVFNLVKAEFIPRLFDLFALALRGGSPPPLILQQSPLVNDELHTHHHHHDLPNAQDGTSAPADRHHHHDCGESASSTETGRNADIDEDSSDVSSRTGGSSSGADSNSSAPVVAEREEDSNDDEEEECLHASMAVPCVPFSPKGQPSTMTITLMNDIDPSKRCFHCVFGATSHVETPIEEGGGGGGGEIENHNRESETPSSLGKIRRISYASLATLL